MLLAYSWWGTREVLSLLGKQCSEQELCQPPRGCNPVNKNLFPSTPIVGLCIKVPCAQAPVCSVPHLHQFSRKTPPCSLQGAFNPLTSPVVNLNSNFICSFYALPKILKLPFQKNKRHFHGNAESWPMLATREQKKSSPKIACWGRFRRIILKTDL